MSKRSAVAAEAVVIRTCYDGSVVPCGIEFDVQEGLTVQADMAGTDLAVILRQYARTGVLPPPREGVYADVSNGFDYHAALNRVRGIEEYFDSLPAKMRDKYGNDPGRFIEEIAKVENEEDARELRLFGLEPLAAPVDPPGVADPGGSAPGTAEAGGAKPA